MRFQEFFSFLFFQSKGVFLLIDGNALLEEFVECFGLLEVDQRLLDVAVEAFVEHGSLGIVV